MLKIPQARLQQYVNRELPDVQAGFRKGRGTRDQIANIRWIMDAEGRGQGQTVNLAHSLRGTLQQRLQGQHRPRDYPEQQFLTRS